MRKPILLVTLLASLLALAACSKLTLTNYDQLKLGMSFQEVRQIIGEPENCSETLGVRACTWKQGAAQVNVSFMADKTILLDAQNLK